MHLVLILSRLIIGRLSEAQPIEFTDCKGLSSYWFCRYFNCEVSIQCGTFSVPHMLKKQLRSLGSVQG